MAPHIGKPAAHVLSATNDRLLGAGHPGICRHIRNSATAGPARPGCVATFRALRIFRELRHNCRRAATAHHSDFVAMQGALTN
jgi:hypothetical protein